MMNLVSLEQGKKKKKKEDRKGCVNTQEEDGGLQTRKRVLGRTVLKDPNLYLGTS